jgi:hypothetical protein
VGTTTVSGLKIGGTVEWVNTKSVTQSGGTVTIGDARGAKAILNNELMGTYDITDDSGIARGSSTASDTDIENAGLFEKTGGTGVSTTVPNLTNNGRIEVLTCRTQIPSRSAVPWLTTLPQTCAITTSLSRSRPLIANAPAAINAPLNPKGTFLVCQKGTFRICGNTGLKRFDIALPRA